MRERANDELKAGPETKIGDNMMLSRRQWLASLLAGAGGAGLALDSDWAADAPAGKVTKDVAKYQDHPNNMQMCGMCKYYTPPGGKAGAGMMGGQMGPGMMGQGGGMMAAGTCQVVEGSINPMGWCVLYQPIKR